MELKLGWREEEEESEINQKGNRDICKYGTRLARTASGFQMVWNLAIAAE